jgi:hypothetical protein
MTDNDQTVPESLPENDQAVQKSKTTIPTPESGAAPKKTGIYLIIGVAAVIIAVLLSYFVLTLPPSSYSTTIYTIYTTTLLPPPSAAFLATLTDPQNALFSLPPTPKMHSYAGYEPNAALVQYGMNFTESFLSTSNYVPPSRAISIPAAYANLTSPLMVSAYTAAYPSVQSASSAYLSTVALFANSSALYAATGASNATTSNLTNIGDHAFLAKFPAYGMQAYGVYFVYKNYTVYTITYCNPNRCQDTYALNISSHIYQLLQNH